MESTIDREAILATFRAHPDQAWKVREVGQALGLGPDDRATLRALLRGLVAEGALTALPNRRFSLPEREDLVTGRVKLHRGYGWLIVEGAGGVDAYLSGDQVLGLSDGDVVQARLGSSHKGPTAEVVRVVTRGRATVTGVLRKSRGALFVEVAPEVLPGPVLLLGDDALPAPEGDASPALSDGHVVEVELLQYPTAVQSARGRVLRVLGFEGELSVEIERILAESRIPRPFPPEVQAEAEAFGALPSEDDLAGREDLRELALCTIDGETAKDFDDAVCARPEGSDVVVTVAIADVSHYVREGTPLDDEARRRGTSVYYPGAVVPMLPEALSNGLCSLKPDVDRLCMAVELRFSKVGKIKSTRFFEGRMKSHARLTYTRVHRFLEGDAAETASIPEPVQASLRLLATVARQLRKARLARGAMDFDLPESVIQLDDEGLPLAIHPQERNDAHKLIEELMLAANEGVASWFFAHGHPCVYRIHEPPDAEKLERFFSLARYVARETGVRAAATSASSAAPAKASAKGGSRGAASPVGVPQARELSRLLADLEESALAQPLNFLLLRAMMQARYAADNLGHYSLASEAYLHFTSPIRRYPDLIVHRLLRAHLRAAPPKKRTRKAAAVEGAGSVEERAREGAYVQLSRIAEECSLAERRATEVERNMDALFQAWFMRDKVGEVFPGVVSGCAEFGVFVRLDLHHVEGMVHVATIGQDYLDFDEVRLRLVGGRSGFSIGVGDAVEVEVTGVDLGKRQVSFGLRRVTRQLGRPVDLKLRGNDPEQGSRQRGYEERRARWLEESGGPRKGGARGGGPRGAGRGDAGRPGGGRTSSARGRKKSR